MKNGLHAVKRMITLMLALLLGCLTAHGQQHIKLMTYNLLNFGSAGVSRTPHFKTVIDSINPDILVVQEILSQSAMDTFYDEVLNSTYNMGTFINGPDMDNGIFYKNYLFTFVSNRPISTALRDINEFTLVNMLYGDTLRIYSLHLKASQGYTNEIKRSQEVIRLRAVTDALPKDKLFIVCGDFNIYYSAEPAYMNLTNDNGITYGHVIDPFDMPGLWNDSAYAMYHTQSPRVRMFGGGAISGMDDRFDMILYSQGIADKKRMYYVEGSTWAVGNDGNHYNDSINAPPNTSVSQAMADALHDASDHLPVVAMFAFDPSAGSDVFYADAGFSLFPNPSSGLLYLSYAYPVDGLVQVFDLAGKLLLAQHISGSKAEVDVSFLEQGCYIMQFSDGKHTGGRVFIKL